jgi:hypothetical protein
MKKNKKLHNTLIGTKFLSKKAEGVFGMSFGMIFTIILIVFFFSAAFIGIRAFLNFQTQAEIGLFFQDFQEKIDEAWNSQSSSYTFNTTLPSGIKYICLINVSAPTKNAANIEKEIFTYVKRGYTDPQKNFYLYSPDKDYGMNWAGIKHIQMAESNPQCIPVEDGFVSIKIERNFEDKFPRIIA